MRAQIIKAGTLVGVVLCGALSSTAQTVREPHTFFKKHIGLSDDQIAAIERGEAVATVLPSQTPAEILVFGAVYVNAPREDHLKFARDIDRLRKLPHYLEIRAFGNPPTLSDLEGFTLQPDDIKNLKKCKPGNCKVQLAAESMQALQKTVDWSRSDVAAQVNDSARRIALQTLVRYQEIGNEALGIYRDKERSCHVAEQFQALLSRSDVLPAYLPELNRLLLDYPNVKLAKAESLFYWEKIDFGLKPTLRLNHAIVYQPAERDGDAHVVAVKQLYASHYFQVALDLSACIRASGRNGERGFYIITLKSSRQEGLTGLRGSILRRVIVRKTRSAQENSLISIKKALESSS